MSESTEVHLPLHVQLEGLLFVAAEPVAPAELAEALDISLKTVEVGLAELESALASRGLRLQRHAGRVQLTTAPELADQVERFLGLEGGSHLSRAGLETLAIIAYNQPITRPQIDDIRGVNSESMLKSLLFKGLIQELGRTQGPGRPILYATTPEFLQHFGLNSVTDLPPVNVPEPAPEPDEMLKG
jgi:segregation and condensation protein B